MLGLGKCERKWEVRGGRVALEVEQGVPIFTAGWGIHLCYLAT